MTDSRRRDEQLRQRRYAAIMGTCLALIVLGWGLVRIWSVTAAVAMSVVAMVLPPVAVVVANAGAEQRLGEPGDRPDTLDVPRGDQRDR